MTQIRVIYHDRCFDGAASAALFARFLQDYYYCAGTFIFRGVIHTPRFQWHDGWFDGDENAIVDFRYSRDPRVTWWFDHHQSAFLSPEDERHFRAHRLPHRVLDPTSSSCASLIAGYLKRKYGYEAVELNELVRWADIIDGAKFPTPESAVEILSPALRLKLVIENATEASVRDFVVRSIRFRPMREILEEPRVRALEQRFAEDQVELVDILLERVHRHGKIVVFDLTDTRVERYNKLMPYAMFGGVDYAIAILRTDGLIRVSLGTNPWSESASLANLAALAERYGGGGHAAVAGIALGPGDLPEARRIAGAIVGQLSHLERQVHPGNGHEADASAGSHPAA